MSWKDALKGLNPFPRGERSAEGILPEETLRRILQRERGRSERTGREFCLVAFGVPARNGRGGFLPLLARTLSARVRQTDAVGWVDRDRVGVVLPETSSGGALTLADAASALMKGRGWPVDFTVYVFPAKWTPDGPVRGSEGGAGGSPPPESAGPGGADAEGAEGADRPAGRAPGDEGRGPREERLDALLAKDMPLWKRLIDILAAGGGLALLAPLMLVVALVTKISSPGPVIFRQTRIGRGGRPFTLVKFRSMAAASEASTHRRHLASLIRSGRPMGKLEGDPRVFWFGRFLRRTCIDELPQLVNVLRGEMSLVGPRPCLPYEAAAYARWHARRFDVAPGMTGLWQVSGKNSLSFQEMVRLDIAYAGGASVWLDLRILLKTPLTVLAGILPRRGGAEGEPT